jgi:hypothetical protein
MVSTLVNPGLFHHKNQNQQCVLNVLPNHILLPSTPFQAISEGTKGVKASRLVAINILKDICGGGVEILLTENDCFDKNDEINEEKVEEYLMQKSDNDKRKKRALLALENIVQQTMKKRKRDVLESERRQTSRKRNHGLRAQGGIRTPSHAFGARKLQNDCLVGTLRIRNLAIHIGQKSSGNISDCHMHHMS